MSSKKKLILPVAIASFCVEQVSASINNEDEIANDITNTNTAAQIEPLVKTVVKKDIKKVSSSSKLYNRESTFNKKVEHSPSGVTKHIIKKVKDIKVSKDIKKVSKNRVATIKTYKKLIKKIKQEQTLVKKDLQPKVKNHYIVKKGDTFRKIAKKTNTSVSKLVKLNKFYKKSHVKVGEKIAIKNSNSFKKIKKSQAKVRANRVLKVTATAYTSHSGQTDDTPYLAAWNNRLKPGMKIIAVSRDLIKKYKLTNGVKVKIKGLKGTFTVRDKMNKRFKNRIDIYMGNNRKKALEWGKKEITLLW